MIVCVHGALYGFKFRMYSRFTPLHSQDRLPIHHDPDQWLTMDERMNEERTETKELQ